MLVLYAVGPASAMRLSDVGYGLLLATLAVGSLLGSFIAGRVERLLGRAGSLALSYGGGAALVGVLAVTANPYLIGAGFVIGSIGLVIGNVVAVSLRQRIAPGRLLGRVNSGYRAGGLGDHATGRRARWSAHPVGRIPGAVRPDVGADPEPAGIHDGADESEPGCRREHHRGVPAIPNRRQPNTGHRG